MKKTDDIELRYLDADALRDEARNKLNAAEDAETPDAAEVERLGTELRRPRRRARRSIPNIESPSRRRSKPARPSWRMPSPANGSRSGRRRRSADS